MDAPEERTRRALYYPPGVVILDAAARRGPVLSSRDGNSGYCCTKRPRNYEKSTFGRAL